jgi:transposase
MRSRPCSRAGRCLAKVKRDLENQIRGLLKNLGRVIGRAKFNGFAAWAAELTEDHAELVAVVAPLLKAREAIEKQIDDLDRKVLKLNNAQRLRSQRDLVDDNCIRWAHQ